MAVNGVKFDRLAKRTVPKSGARKIPAKLQSSSFFLMISVIVVAQTHVKNKNVIAVLQLQEGWVCVC